MNGRCSSCGKYLELTSDVNGVCAECFNETYSTPETYDDVVKRVLEPYTPTDPITFTYSQIPTETLLMIAKRKIKAYEEIIGYLVSTKQVYGSKKKLHSSAYVLSDAINLIWKEMKIHCRTIKIENDVADIDMRFEDIIKLYKESTKAQPAERE